MEREPYAVRAAEPKDAAGLAEVQVRAWREAYRNLLPAAALAALSVPRGTRNWKTLLRRGTSRTFLARAMGGEVLAFVNLGPYRGRDLEDGRLLELRALYVRPGHWRAGIGSALVDTALREGRGRGARRMVLWVLASNEPAKAFYRAMGFRPDGGTKLDRRLDGLELREERWSLLL